MSELDALFNEFDQQEQLGRTTATEPTEAAKSTTAQPPEKYAKSVLFVRGVPKDATNEELEGFFSNVGPVRSCFVVCDKKPEGSEDAPAAAENNKTVKNRGFGFVQFVLAEDAARAIEQLAETKFRDQKRLMLDFAMRKGTRDPADKVPAKRPRQNAKQQDAKQQDTKQQDAKQGATQQDAEQQDAKQQDRPDHAAKKQKLNSGTKVESRTITIGSLPAGVTKKHLVKRVKKVGNPHSIVYPAPFKGATDEQLKDGAGGSAHITFGDHAGAMAAIKALNNHVFKGAKLSVKLRTEYVNKNARLIVRNLPFKIRERDLENMLSGCGTVLEVDLPRKFTGGPLRGFAFVQMGDYGSAKRAVEKWDQSTLQGRTLSVGMAIAKDRFKEMEEKGEVEKPDFADSDEEMEAADSNDESASTAESDGEDGENNMDVDDDGEETGTAASDLDDKDQSDVVDESLQEGCTVFIRNLSFDSDEDDLFEHFRKFGRLRYCRIVYDQQTGRSRGTAFVCFWNPADAASCIEAAEKAQKLSEKLSNVTSGTRPDQRSKSVILQEAPSSLDATSQFILDGRLLSVVKAVDRSRAHNLAVEGIQQRKSKDKRHAYLLKEGIIFPETPAAALMATADLDHHLQEYSVRKNQILKNPNLYMSKTRLTVHNVPRSIDDAALRSAAVSAVSKFKQEVKDNVRKPLAKDEMEEGWDKLPRVTQAKIVRSADRVDADTGKARSKGYGFIEFSTHAHALACLRYLNFRNSKQAFSKHLVDDEEPDESKKSAHQISRRSLRVMFAIENAQIVKKRSLRFTRAANKSAAKDGNAEATDSARAGKGRGKSPAKGKPRFGVAPRGRGRPFKGKQPRK